MRIISLLLLTIFSLSACSFIKPGAESTPVAAAGTAATAEMASSPAAGSTSTQLACPAPTDTEKLYGGTDAGYCFVYPSDFYLYPAAAIILRSPPHGSGAEQAGGAMTISTEALQGRSLADYAGGIIAANNSGGQPSQQAVTTANGYPALTIDGLASQLNWRAVLIEHGGKVYQLSFQPWDPSLPDVQADLGRIYSTVLASWVFLK